MWEQQRDNCPGSGGGGGGMQECEEQQTAIFHYLGMPNVLDSLESSGDVPALLLPVSVLTTPASKCLHAPWHPGPWTWPRLDPRRHHHYYLKYKMIVTTIIKALQINCSLRTLLLTFMPRGENTPWNQTKEVPNTLLDSHARMKIFILFIWSTNITVNSKRIYDINNNSTSLNEHI